MEQDDDYYYVIGVGEVEDWQAGHGSIHYIEDRNRERALPVFTVPERAENYVHSHLVTPEAHLSMLESVGEAGAGALTVGRFKIMPLDTVGVARAAAIAEADYLVRDPRPGKVQEILRP